MHLVIPSSPFFRDTRGWLMQLRVAFLGSVAFAFTACGERAASSRETGTRESSSMIAVCDLLTRDEVAEVLQSPVGEPEEQVIGQPGPNRAGLAHCRYTASDGSNRFVSISLRQSPVADNDPAGLREAMSSGGSQPVEVAGVGDAALWDGMMLHVFSGGKTYLTISVSGFSSNEQTRDTCKTLALTALPRIGNAGH